jgi:hypothetical protein
MSVVTAWIKPAQEIVGRDHLAARAPCENIYAQLLPGITNVTDRARCYSFYPWLVWAIEQRYAPLTMEKFVQLVRRADCLFTLIGAWHGSQTGDDEGGHGAALVGRNTLLNVLGLIQDGQPQKLSTYAITDDTPQRYFKHRLGGLGQYYLGTFYQLGILAGSPRAVVKYTPQRGEPLAEAFDAGVDRDGFFDALEADEISEETLEHLQRFCPCHLPANPAEHALLLDLFFNRGDTFYEAAGMHRRATLGLLLDLAAHFETEEPDYESWHVGDFRACVYSGHLPNKRSWELTPPLEAARRRWAVYQRNELLSIAVQGIFWAALVELEKSGGWLPDREALRRWFISSFAGKVFDKQGRTTFLAAVGRARASLPEIGDWENETHEMMLGWDLEKIINRPVDDNSPAEALQVAMEILLALAAREEDTHAEYDLFPNVTQLESYPINLTSLRVNTRQQWRDLPLGDLLGWLVTHWGLDVHLRVALRKLQAEGRDTFRIKPTDEGLRLVGHIQPAFTSPRITQALQILRDLGALAVDENTGGRRLTETGRTLLEHCRA